MMTPQYLDCGMEQCPPSIISDQINEQSYFLKFFDNFEDSQRRFSFIFNGFLTLFCVCMGVILNIFSIIVFLRFRQGSTTTIIQCYLVTLTIWQTALLISAFFLYCLPTLIFGRVVLNGIYVFIYPYSYLLSNMTHTGSVWLVLTLTIDRFLALCHPLTHPSMGNKRRVKRLMIIVSASAVLFSLPRFFEVAVIYRCSDSQSGSVKLECEPNVYRTFLTQSTAYWRVYRIFLNSIFVTIGPCLLLFVLTLRISFALNKSGQRRKSLCQSTASECLVVEIRKNSTADSGRSSQNKDRRANLILVLVILKFLVSNLLPSIVDVFEYIIGDENFMSSPMATVIVDFSNFLLVLNCSTNFWVFLLWGKRFRQNCYCLCLGSRLGTAFAKLINIESELGSMNTFQATATSRTRNNFISTTDLRHESSVFPLNTTLPNNRRASEAVGTKNSTKKSKRARSCTDDFIDRQRLLSNVMK